MLYRRSSGRDDKSICGVLAQCSLKSHQFPFCAVAFPPIASIDLVQAPTNLQNPRPDDAYQPRAVASSHEPDQAIVVASLRGQELPRNGYPGQATEAHDGVQTRVPSAKDFRLAQLSYKDWGETDVASRGEAEEETKDDQLGDTPATVLGGTGEPHREDGDETQGHRDDHRIEPSE